MLSTWFLRPDSHPRQTIQKSLLACGDWQQVLGVSQQPETSPLSLPDQSSVSLKSANDGSLLSITSVVTRDLVMRSIRHPPSRHNEDAYRLVLCSTSQSSKSGFLWQRCVPPGYSKRLQQTQCRWQLSGTVHLGCFQLGWHLFNWNSMINQFAKDWKQLQRLRRHRLSEPTLANLEFRTSRKPASISQIVKISNLEREVEEMQAYSTFPRPVIPVPRSWKTCLAPPISLPRFVVTYQSRYIWICWSERCALVWSRG
jgi:hypothetical protein